MSKDNFYLRKVTQSQYRRHANDDDSDENPTYLNLSLSKLEIADKETREKLKAKIREQAEQVVRAMLPEKLAESLVQKEEYLAESMKGLGL